MKRRSITLLLGSWAAYWAALFAIWVAWLMSAKSDVAARETV